MRKYAGFLGKVAKFGFYIILFLCISAIGISGYVMYLARNTAEDVRKSTEPGGSIELPFPSEYKSVYSPAEILDEAKIFETEEKTEENAPKTPDKEEIGAEKKAPPPVKEKEQSEKKEETMVYAMALKGAVSVPFSDGELVKSRTMDDWRIHEGVDIKGDVGTSVVAIADGVIEDVTLDAMFGNIVKIAHTNGLCSIYANLADEIPVKKGDEVKTGDVIGAVGTSAVSECLDAPHLHFEVISDGRHIDPLSLYPSGEE